MSPHQLYEKISTGLTSQMMMILMLTCCRGRHVQERSGPVMAWGRNCCSFGPHLPLGRTTSLSLQSSSLKLGRRTKLSFCVFLLTIPNNWFSVYTPNTQSWICFYDKLIISCKEFTFVKTPSLGMGAQMGPNFWWKRKPIATQHNDLWNLTPKQR